MLQKVIRIIGFGERLPIANAGMTLISIILLRNFLEALLENRHSTLLFNYRDIVDALHVLCSWLVVYVMMSLILSIFGGQSQIRVNRIVLRVFPIIILPPLFDFAIGYAGQVSYQYHFREFISSFIGLFNPWVNVSYVTPGVRVEIFIATLTSTIYVALVSFYKNKKNNLLQIVLRSFLVFISVYTLPFLLGYLPAIWQSIVNVNLYDFGKTTLSIGTGLIAIGWYLPLIIVILPVWIWRSNLHIKERHNSPWQWIMALLDKLFHVNTLLPLLIVNGTMILNMTQNNLQLVHVYDLLAVLWINFIVLLLGISRQQFLHSSENLLNKGELIIWFLLPAFLAILANGAVFHIVIAINCISWLISQITRLANLSFINRFLFWLGEALWFCLLIVYASASMLGQEANNVYQYLSVNILVATSIIPVLSYISSRLCR